MWNWGGHESEETPWDILYASDLRWQLWHTTKDSSPHTARSPVALCRNLRDNEWNIPPLISDLYQAAVIRIRRNSQYTSTLIHSTPRHTEILHSIKLITTPQRRKKRAQPSIKQRDMSDRFFFPTGSWNNPTEGGK